jgi:serine/threonine protein kinase
VHRDLKPENLLIDKNNSLKIADFGLSNTYKTGETLKTACGSPSYAAPEMIQGESYTGTAVDVWSSGIVLYAMLCGFLPFDDPNTSNLYKKIVKGEFLLPKFLSESASSLISGILNVDPLERFSIEAIKAHKWFNLVNFEPKTGIFIGEMREVVDEQVIEMTAKFGVDLEVIRKSVERNKHNHASTVYYLLKKKWDSRETRKSPSLSKAFEIKKKDLFKKIEPVRKKSEQKELKVKKEVKINQKLTITRPVTSRSPTKITSVWSKPSTPSKSTRNSVSPGKKSPILSVYSGPYDVDCITSKSLSLVMKGVNSVLSYLEIKSSVINYKYKCIDLSNLTIEVCRLQGTEMHLVKFENVQNYTHVVEDIINLLDL